METVRKLTAAIVGIIIIIAIILLAKWVGDRVRERFFQPRQPVVIQQQTPKQTQDADSAKTATYSAIPSTGPKETAYLLFAFLAVSGLASIKLAKGIA